jgi:glycosyltransferase involved in cell wall biosynthesis
MKRTSIIIPLYNNMWYVENAINSALDQVLSNDCEIEVIVVDDCSDDNSLGIVKSLFSDMGNVKVLKNEVNQGISKTRNKAIMAARGRYVYLLDSDDYIHTHTINTLTNIIELLDDSYIGVKTDYYYVADDDTRSKQICSSEIPIACGIMLRKSMLINIGMFDENLNSFEEKDLFNRIKSNNKKIAHIPVPFYRYRMHHNNHTKHIDIPSEYNVYMKKQTDS